MPLNAAAVSRSEPGAGSNTKEMPHVSAESRPMEQVPCIGGGGRSGGGGGDGGDGRLADDGSGLHMPNSRRLP